MITSFYGLQAVIGRHASDSAYARKKNLLRTEADQTYPLRGFYAEKRTPTERLSLENEYDDPIRHIQTDPFRP